MTSSDETDSSNVPHFEFGRNWSRFLSRLSDSRIQTASASVRRLLKSDSLANQSFLDAGCGSGLFGLAAHQLGAVVTSFDFDEHSVKCAEYLRATYGSGTTNWGILQGSLLDTEFMHRLGTFNVVYCWGVAHHTGAMWRALELLAPCVKDGGQCVIAIYNDQEYLSRGWWLIKSVYQRLPKFLRPLYVLLIGIYWPLKRSLTTLIASVLRLVTLRNPLVPFMNWIRELRNNARGMHVWTDLVDWVGGWPFEVAKPEEVFRFFRDRGFVLEEITTCSGHGCNEFVFRRTHK